MLPGLKLPSNPTCGVVVRKNGDGEKVCGEPASQLVTMVDPDNKTTVTALLLVCERHDRELEAGKQFIFLSDDKQDRILVRYHSKEER